MWTSARFTRGDLSCTTSANRERESLSKNYCRSRLRIILVRHGESQNNLYHEISLQVFEENRVADPSITERGMQQAQCVADYFQSGENMLLQDVHEMYVSPMLRTMQTATPIAKALNICPIVWTEIHEISGVHDRGIGQGGMTRTEMQQQFPDYKLPDNVTEFGWYDTKLGRESDKHGRQRVQSVWQHLVKMANELSEDHTIVMVVHGDFIDQFLQVSLDIAEPVNSYAKDDPLEEKHKVFPTWNASISALDLCMYKNQKPTILFHNSVAHLAPHLVKTQKLGKC